MSEHHEYFFKSELALLYGRTYLHITKNKTLVYFLNAYLSIKRIKRRTPIQKNNILNIRIWLIIVKRLITLDRSSFMVKKYKIRTAELILRKMSVSLSEIRYLKNK